MPPAGRPRPTDLLIERVDEIGSTSTELLDRRQLVAAADRAGLADDSGVIIRPASVGAVWLIAADQTGGRGRRGRQWRSDPRASLTASLAIEAGLPADPAALTLVAGAAVATTLQSFGTRPWLKWPNDIYLRDAAGELTKAGGILCESRIIASAGPGSDRPTWRLVIGCGLNLFPSADRTATITRSRETGMGGNDNDRNNDRNNDSGNDNGNAVAADAAAVPAGPPPGHLFEYADPELRDRLEQALGLALARAVNAALHDGPAAGLANWARFDLLAGQAVSIHGSDGISRAIARGIDASGRLLVSDAAEPAPCRALVAEEVSIRRLQV